MRPQLDASKDLKKIVSRLTKTTENNFTQKLDDWCEIYKDFLDEQSISSTTGELHYTHPRIRAAYRSLRTNLPYLFTYKNYKNLSISNTTNALVPQGHKKRWRVLSHEKYDKFTSWIE